MKKLITAVLCVIFISACSYNESPYSNISRSFMEKIKQGDTAQAYRVIFPDNSKESYNVIPPEQFNSIVLRTNSHLKAAGPVFNYVKTDDVRLTSHLAKIVYIAHHQRAPTQWTFYFIKSEEGVWRSLNMSFQDKIDEF